MPPPHDDRSQTSVPMTTTPNAILNIGNSRWAVSVHSRPEGSPALTASYAIPPQPEAAAHRHPIYANLTSNSLD